jgi:glutathione S-transferase
MTNAELTLVGRSSSHFTRTTRIFALELEVPHVFRPVLDIMKLDPGTYGDNPALKVPVLVDAQGPLFGTENICRELARRSGRRDRVVLRGDVSERVVANAEELVLHAMSAEVILITGALAKVAEPPKVRPSLENALAFLEMNLDGALAFLPPDRVISFFETALFCVVTHLPFREVMEVGGYPCLQAFCQSFGARAGAQATAYRFDAP